MLFVPPVIFPANLYLAILKQPGPPKCAYCGVRGAGVRCESCGAPK